MKTVLIIDDDADYRCLMGEILRAEGWQVLEADDGAKGVELARQNRPLAVLCDLLMPRVDGYQVCRAIRREPDLRGTKIIVTSGRDFESDREAAREAGADEYLTKPFPSERLLNLLASLGAGHAAETVLKQDADTAAEGGARIRFWGVRGSIPTPGAHTVRYGGNTSCVEVRAGGEIIILDAGTGLRALGQALMKEFAGKPMSLTLLLTHTHWDHIQGLPFFNPLYSRHCRLRILGCEGARKGLLDVLADQMESPHFPVPLGDLPSKITIEELKDFSFGIGPVRVEARRADHPGICVGYRLFTGGRSVAYFPDNELQPRRPGGSMNSPDSATTRQTFACLDEEKMAEFLRETDALILDAQYDAEEYQQHQGWGHGCVDAAVSLSLSAGVRRLFLFHHDPDHDDARLDRMVADARQLAARAKGVLQVEAAREGEMVELAPIEEAQSAKRQR